MRVVPLAVGASVVLAALAVALAADGLGTGPAQRILLFWIAVTFLLAGLALWLHDRHVRSASR